MNTTISPLFPTPITLVNDFISESERVVLLKKVLKIRHQHHSALIGDAFSSFDYGEIIKECVGESLINKINKQISTYSDLMGYGKREDIKLKSIWSNIQKKGSQLKRHRHPNSKITGALYLNINSNSSSIYFYNPNPYIYFDSYEKYNDYNCQYYKIIPLNSQLILFPSWLEHGSEEEKNNSESRVVISFNAI